MGDTPESPLVLPPSSPGGSHAGIAPRTDFLRARVRLAEEAGRVAGSVAGPSAPRSTDTGHGHSVTVR